MKHVFDVGANTGQIFDGFLRHRPEYDHAHVWCFEPSPRNWPKLAETASRYAGRYQVTLCPFAIGETGISRFYQSHSGEGDSVHLSLRTHDGTPMTELATLYDMVVSSVDLGMAIEELTGPDDRITVKLDCEGCEYDILRALLADPVSIARCDRFLVEFHVMAGRDSTAEKNELLSAYSVRGIRLEPWIM